MYFDVELSWSANMNFVPWPSPTHPLLDIATSSVALFRLVRVTGWPAVGSDCGDGSVNFCLFGRRLDGGVFASEVSVGLGARVAEAFRFREVATRGFEADSDGGEGAVGVEVGEAPDPAASLAEERVTLRDMSNGSHQDTRVELFK